MKETIGPYILSFEAERFYQGTRYHWMICGAKKPDELISWGYASSQEQAEAEARNELRELASGLTHGGRAPHCNKSSTSH